MSASSPKIQALAIISPRNGPIYIRQFHTSNVAADLRYHYFAHSALDIVDERSASSSGSSSRPNASEQYVGLLCTLEDLAIYGFQTCTRMRLLLMLSLTDHAVRDIDMLTLFRAVQSCWLRYSSNPFHSLPPTKYAKGIVKDKEEDATARASVRQDLEQKQGINLPINCRQIRSAAFDARIDRIVFGSSKALASASAASTKPVSAPTGR
ncbi:uncharacterized protein MEPE_04204 [Melanopsichium pennsylvanicum]|uniref:Sedlin n=2 Tax=Melanopsichium pennsylvanicum TaxID=63383 RepID=A0AAJ4XNF8_9BASI|nr:conserved hypothetical protein [Melanopsichium pennsylvanicum 4]SNX85495.1 uncharacterized protein MEPE_04204 [Melanopsichium pennsylvanicum]